MAPVIIVTQALVRLLNQAWFLSHLFIFLLCFLFFVFCFLFFVFCFLFFVFCFLFFVFCFLFYFIFFVSPKKNKKQEKEAPLPKEEESILIRTLNDIMPRIKRYFSFFFLFPFLFLFLTSSSFIEHGEIAKTGRDPGPIFTFPNEYY